MGETVSPYRNLLKMQVSVESNKRPEASSPDKSKAHKGDDTSEASFQGGEVVVPDARTAFKALEPKQPVTEAGDAIKAEDVALVGKVEAEAKLPTAGVDLQDDIAVAEGLRSPRWLWEALYSYQHIGVRYLWDLHQKRLGGILADEMGLGKTVQVAAYLGVLHHSGVLQNMTAQNTSLGSACSPSTGGVLIVCPPTLIHQWKSEIHLWYPSLRVCAMHYDGEGDHAEAIRIASSQQGVLVTSFQTMRIRIKDLLKVTWVMVVLDEGQKIRNPTGAVTLAAKQFSTPHRLILSGSPIQNNLQELWSLFDFVCPGRLGTFPVFMEEFASPIELGNMVGSNEARVATAYQCALALRELTFPLILRRTKAEVMDTIQLPAKQEQVLFCHLTADQYQIYLDFLQTDQVRKAMEERNILFATEFLRKLCNHPDLLLEHADEDMKPPDMWNHERSGKMKVLAEIMRLWWEHKHRALIFAQTVKMVEIIQHWMNQEGYAHLRIDSKTPVSKRPRMIEEFNGNPQLFAMILTKGVGGVGLNIIGADRVVIVEPDWDPMTDVQARERAWRIGQRKNVAIYRLCTTTTVEEKVYHRQSSMWNDLAGLFEVPKPPPDFVAADRAKLRWKYKGIFAGLKSASLKDDDEGETNEIMKSFAALPTSGQHTTNKETVDEHNAILKTLFDASGIKTSFKHDKFEQPLLDHKIVRDGASMVAQRALAALKNSTKCQEGSSESQPARGLSGTGPPQGGGHVLSAGVKREVLGRPPSTSACIRAVTGRVPSADILEGLKRLSTIRAMSRMRTSSQSDDASRLGLCGGTANRNPQTVKSEAPALKAIAKEAANIGSERAVAQLHKSEKRVAELILEVFLDPEIGGPKRQLEIVQVQNHLGKHIARQHQDLFKNMLMEICVLDRTAGQGIWHLRPEFCRPKFAK